MPDPMGDGEAEAGDTEPGQEGIPPEAAATGESFSDESTSTEQLDGGVGDMAMPEEALSQPAAAFEQLQEPATPGQSSPLSMLYDLDLPVAIELGRTRMAVQDVLALARGSVVQLDRQAGEPVDVYVGDKRFAEGEVVVVGEQFGIRITRLVSNAGLPVAG